MTLKQQCERRLDASGVPYVKVDEAKRALFALGRGGKLKTFDFIVYRESGPNLLVMARRNSPAVRKNLQQWSEAFGEGFLPALAYSHNGAVVFRDLGGNELEVQA